MNEGLNGWYGLVVIFAVVGIIALVGSILGAAAIRLMLRDDVYFPDER